MCSKDGQNMYRVLDLDSLIPSCVIIKGRFVVGCDVKLCTVQGMKSDANYSTSSL